MRTVRNVGGAGGKIISPELNLDPDLCGGNAPSPSKRFLCPRRNSLWWKRGCTVGRYIGAAQVSGEFLALQ